MEVLIVGGTGLISTGITRELVAAGHGVTCYTRGETSAEVPDGVSFVHGDRNDHDRFATQVAGLEVDCVIDMVCFSPEQAEAAVDAFAGEIEQYVLCSTVDVYHRPPARNPVTEGAAREPAVSEYGRKKAEAENVLLGVDGDAFRTTVIRPWSTYDEKRPILHTFGSGTYYLDRLRKGKPIVVHGDGSSLWGPCHRDDVARAFANAVGNTAAYGEAYHVTSEEVVSWNRYHEIVADALGAPEPEFVHIPTDRLRAAVPDRTEMLEAHFQYSTVFDNAKARRDLDFSYTIPFAEGVREGIDHLEAEGEIDPWDAENDDAIIEAWRDSTAAFPERVTDRLEGGR